MDLFHKQEEKETLTEHLCTVIHQNELRKGRKLVELMEKLDMEASAEEMALDMSLPSAIVMESVKLPKSPPALDKEKSLRKISPTSELTKNPQALDSVTHVTSTSEISDKEKSLIMTSPMSESPKNPQVPDSVPQDESTLGHNNSSVKLGDNKICDENNQNTTKDHQLLDNPSSGMQQGSGDTLHVDENKNVEQTKVQTENHVKDEVDNENVVTTASLDKNQIQKGATVEPIKEEISR